MTLKKKNKVTFIIVISFIVLLIVFMIYELIARNTGMKSLMGNSLTTSFYYCEDNSYTLNNDKCVKTETASSNILGDVNLDGKVDNSDLELLNNYLAKTVDLTDIQLTAADVNSDGILSVGDAENIRLYVTGHNSGSEYLSKIGISIICPKDYTDKDNSCIKENIVDAKYASYKRGDINLDGKLDNRDLELLSKYLKKQAKLNTVQINVADYNNSGMVDNNDLKQINLTKEQLNYADMNDDGVVDDKDVDILAKTISDYYQVGDINLDGKINELDVTVLQNMFNGVVVATKVQLNLCDINGDGTINNNDVVELRKKVSKDTKYKKGDVNLDGELTSADVTIIENYVLKKTELTIDQLNYADYNGDSVVDNKDANSLARAIASKYKKGDINMDGKINIIDISILSKYISRLVEIDTTQKILADVNGDGKINASDLKK